LLGHMTSTCKRTSLTDEDNWVQSKSWSTFIFLFVAR
jgi:hypothetical protein